MILQRIWITEGWGLDHGEGENLDHGKGITGGGVKYTRRYLYPTVATTNNNRIAFLQKIVANFFLYPASLYYASNELKDNYTLQFQYRYLWYKETRLFVISIQTWITDFRIQEEPESMEVTVPGE